MSTLDMTKAATMLHRAATDPTYKKTLQSDPTAGLKAAGVVIPTDPKEAAAVVANVQEALNSLPPATALSSNWFGCQACKVGFGAVAVAIFAAIQLIPGVDVGADIAAAAAADGVTVAEWMAANAPTLISAIEAAGLNVNAVTNALAALGSFSVGGILQMLCGPGVISACS